MFSDDIISNLTQPLSEVEKVKYISAKKKQITYLLYLVFWLCYRLVTKLENVTRSFSEVVHLPNTNYRKF